MKKLLFIVPLAVVAALWFINRGNAQEKTPPKYEYAVLKWDGPDRLYYNMPDRFEMVHLEKQGVKIPGEAQNEEWSLAYGANQLSREGWEPICFDSRRLLLRRPR